MSTESKDLPYLTPDLEDADRAARIRSSRHGVGYFIGMRISEEGEPVYLVAPLTAFQRFYDAGWLLEHTYGESRDPHDDFCVYVAADYEDAMLEAALRLHRVGIATAVAVRRDEFDPGYIVAPVDHVPELDADGYRICDVFLRE